MCKRKSKALEKDNTNNPNAVEPQDDLPAGDFSTWLGEMQRALRGAGQSLVPCGDCTACCTSAQFVHIGPDETESLKHIPQELLFPAPGLPAGHLVLGYDKRGHCPMLKNGKCSIYAHRPRTCRTYDCRIFAATGVDQRGEKPLIARQASRWKFSFAEERDLRQKSALEAAAKELQSRGTQNLSPAQLAVQAVELLSK